MLATSRDIRCTSSLHHLSLLTSIKLFKGSRAHFLVQIYFHKPLVSLLTRLAPCRGCGRSPTNVMDAGSESFFLAGTYKEVHSLEILL